MYLNIPTAPLRPSFRWSGPDSALEVEALVTRAVSCDDNWRRPLAKLYTWNMVSAYYDIRDMKLLPGGRFLVASVQHGSRYFIVIYNMDSPRGSLPVARYDIPVKGYNLDAKYLRYRGHDGIMISFFGRCWETITEENKS